MAKPKPKPLDAFLSENPPAPQPAKKHCKCCDLKHADVLNAAVRRLAERRALPSDHVDATTMTRREFFTAYVVSQFPGFRASDPRVFYSHASECLGVDLG